MTWVAAMASAELPEAACVADIQITFKYRNKEVTHNGLRKVYRITHSLAVAFSGTVSIAFRLLENMRQQEAPLHDKPHALMTSWPTSAARVFRASQKKEKEGVGLLVLGLDHNHSGQPMPFVYKLESPDFTPYKANGAELLSIGCGTRQYAAAIQNTCNEPNSFRAYERREFRGRGIGIGLVGMMAMEWRSQPAKGVSEELLCCIVSPYDSVDFPYRASIGNASTGETRQVGMPQLATSWAEVQRIAKSLGLSAAGAIC